MSAIDAYKNCNLHLAAPYIGGKCPGMQKSRGERPTPRGDTSEPRKHKIGLLVATVVCTKYSVSDN